MTSKEALDNMYTLLAIHHLASEKDYLQIKQDLEVLEILKHYAVNDGWYNGWVINFWKMNSRELEKVYEVLKNEKN